MEKYDYLVVGAGLFGSVFAREMTDAGKRCLVIDKKEHIGGQVYTEKRSGVTVQIYGAHIFHTDSERVWNYMRRFTSFLPYVHSPLAIYNDEVYNLPFNMNTFSRLWDLSTPEEAKKKIAEETAPYAGIEPQNLEEQALKLVGGEIYEKLVRGYTEKQWGRPARELPAWMIRRLPLRFTYDNNYYNDRYQGMPEGGYTPLLEKLLEGCDLRFGIDYCQHEAELTKLAKKVVFTGALDEFYGYRFGALEYRSLSFEHRELRTDNFQGAAVVNYTSADVPYTRIIEHKHFFGESCDGTVISREYPVEWSPGAEPYYPVNDARNDALYRRYRELTDSLLWLIVGGRLADYRYYDMDDAVAAALDAAEKEKARLRGGR